MNLKVNKNYNEHFSEPHNLNLLHSFGKDNKILLDLIYFPDHICKWDDYTPYWISSILKLIIMIGCNQYFTYKSQLVLWKATCKAKGEKVKVPGLQLLREVASVLWQSTESFNNRQRAHDGSGPMGFKRINIQVNSKQRCIMGTALHCG